MDVGKHFTVRKTKRTPLPQNNDNWREVFKYINICTDILKNIIPGGFKNNLDLPF